MFYFSYSHFDEAFQSCFKRFDEFNSSRVIIAVGAQFKRDGLVGSALIILLLLLRYSATDTAT